MWVTVSEFEVFSAHLLADLLFNGEGEAFNVRECPILFYQRMNVQAYHEPRSDNSLRT